MLRYHRAHQEAAIASALDRKFFRARVLLLDQGFGGGRELVEHGLLFRTIASLVPFFAKSTASSNVRHHIHAAALEPEPARRVDIRRNADTGPTLSVKP